MKVKRAFGQKFARTVNSRVAYFVPHSFLFPVIFTFLTYLLGIFVTYQGPFDMVKFWVEGFWSFLAVSMQMVLMVTAGLSMALAPISQKILRFLATLPKTPRGGVMFMTALTALCSWIHWGIGIIAGAFLAREMGRKIPRMDYPFLVASAFIGMGAGNFGIFTSDLVARKTGYIFSMAQAPFRPISLVGFLLGTAAITLFLGLVCPREEDAVPPSPEILERFEREDRADEVILAAEEEIRQRGKMSFGLWLEHSRWPVWLISIMGFSCIVFWFYRWGFALNLDVLNFILLTLTISLHDTPMHFLRSMERAARSAHGIIVQFPFYAGVGGMLVSSGLATVFFERMASVATEWTFPLVLYLNAAFTNLFVPLSGTLWEIQGTLVVKTAESLNATVPRALHAFSAGEIIGDVIHPFWALPLLGICGLSMRDIMGYCLLAFLILSVIWVGCVTLLPI